MARLNRVCPGDCSRCKMLANGEVDMQTCVLDQIFQRVQKLDKAIAELQSQSKENNPVINLVGGHDDATLSEEEEE